MNYEQREELFRTTRGSMIFNQRKFSLGYEIGLRGYLPTMLIILLYLLFIGPVYNWIIFVAATTAVMAGCVLWARKKYDLYVTPTFYWSFFWRYILYSILLFVVFAICLIPVIFLVRSDPEVIAFIDTFGTPLVLMLTIGNAASVALWLQVRGIPVHRIVKTEEEIDPDLESLMGVARYKRTEFDNRTVLPYNQSLEFQYLYENEEEEILPQPERERISLLEQRRQETREARGIINSFGQTMDDGE